MMKILLSLLLFLLLGCSPKELELSKEPAHRTLNLAPKSSFRLSIHDAAEEKAVKIVLSNYSSGSICLSEFSWPTDSKFIDTTENIDFKISVDGLEYPYLSENEIDICEQKDCTIELKPNETITGFVDYTYFNLPPSQWLRKKKISGFSVEVDTCS